MRLISLLEVIASKERPFSRQELAEDAGVSGATLHRMLAQLAGAGLLQRSGDGRRYDKGARLRLLAESLLLNSDRHGAQHAALRQLAAHAGETCTLVGFSSDEVVYLDQVETTAPLRLHLRAGARVPAHCSASGKMFLAQMTPMQRRRLLEQMTLQAHTCNTLTGLDAIEEEIRLAGRQGFALDNEEFVSGVRCIAVLVPSPRARSHLCVVAQAPVMRFTREKALGLLPALQRAALALSAIESQAALQSPGASA